MNTIMIKAIHRQKRFAFLRPIMIWLGGNFSEDLRSLYHTELKEQERLAMFIELKERHVLINRIYLVVGMFIGSVLSFALLFALGYASLRL